MIVEMKHFKEEIELIKGLFKNTDKHVYIVGGYVRDTLLGVDPSDIDFAVNMSRDEITKFVSWRFKVVDFLSNNKGTLILKHKNIKVEISPLKNRDYYRQKSLNYKDQNFDQNLDFDQSYNTIEEDLSLRDLSINAMAIDLKDDSLIDPFNGYEDLQKKILRTPTKAFDRLYDDPLRLFRTIRFAAKYDFKIHRDIFEAANSIKERFELVPRDRILIELDKLMSEKNWFYGFEYLLYQNLLGLPNFDPKIKSKKETFDNVLDILCFNSVSKTEVFLNRLRKADFTYLGNDDKWLLIFLTYSFFNVKKDNIEDFIKKYSYSVFLSDRKKWRKKYLFLVDMLDIFFNNFDSNVTKIEEDIHGMFIYRSGYAYGKNKHELYMYLGTLLHLKNLCPEDKLNNFVEIVRNYLSKYVVFIKEDLALSPSVVMDTLNIKKWSDFVYDRLLNYMFYDKLENEAEVLRKFLSINKSKLCWSKIEKQLTEKKNEKNSLDSLYLKLKAMKS